jgi:hypothetical protein
LKDNTTVGENENLNKVNKCKNPNTMKKFMGKYPNWSQEVENLSRSSNKKKLNKLYRDQHQKKGK